MSKALPFREAPQWSVPIKDLRLTIAGTPLEPTVEALRDELRSAALLRITPEFYLSTEWGVPFGTVAIAIPFYLASAELTALHADQVGHIEGLGPPDILRYLRHEMGHVVSYAYRLYEEAAWIHAFGSMAIPYEEDYRPHPFSKGFVRHLPGWYAQKHPDEDWAETFAVWLTPGSDWRRDYADWPIALAKLIYCDEAMKRISQRDPVDQKVDRDEDVTKLTYSLEHFYRASQLPDAALPHWLDSALIAMFGVALPAESTLGRVPASAILRRLERDLLASVYRWTGHFPERTRALVRRLAERADALGLSYLAAAEEPTVIEVTTVVTALAMTFVHRGDYAA